MQACNCASPFIADLVSHHIKLFPSRAAYNRKKLRTRTSLAFLQHFESSGEVRRRKKYHVVARPFRSLPLMGFRLSVFIFSDVMSGRSCGSIPSWRFDYKGAFPGNSCIFGDWAPVDCFRLGFPSWGCVALCDASGGILVCNCTRSPV